MPGTLDASLGTNSISAFGGPTSLTLTTANAVSAGGKACVAIHAWDTVAAGGQAVVSSVADNDGGTWTVDRQGTHTNTNDIIAIAHCDKPSGMASGKVVTVTFSLAPEGGGEIVGASFLGLVLGATDAVEAAVNSTSGTSFSSGSVTGGADDLFFGGIALETAATSIPATFSVGTKVSEVWNATSQQGCLCGYINGSGSQSVSGTIPNTSTATAGLIVAFTALATTAFLPRRMPLGV